jgi:hypothetical protein
MTAIANTSTIEANMSQRRRGTEKLITEIAEGPSSLAARTRKKR